MSFLDLVKSFIQYGTAFQDEYGVSYLEALKIDIADNMQTSNILDLKILNTICLYVMRVSPNGSINTVSCSIF